MKRIILAFALLIVFALSAQAKQPALGQFYVCTGVDPSGDTYTVGMETKVIDEVTWFREVTPNGTVVLMGQGFYNKDHFIGIEWFGGSGDSDHAGIVDYTIKGNRLEGKWKVMNDAKVYTETCVAASGAPQPKAEPVEAPRSITNPGQTKV